MARSQLQPSYNPIIDATGKVVRVMKFASDITARVQKSQQARAAAEQGRGFAVVADEVRKLAGRTSLATTEIGQVVSQHCALTVQVSSAIGAVTEVAEQGKQQVLDVETIMAETQQGAQVVQAAVAELN